MPADADILGKTNLHGWQIFQESMKAAPLIIGSGRSLGGAAAGVALLVLLCWRNINICLTVADPRKNERISSGSQIPRSFFPSVRRAAAQRRCASEARADISGVGAEPRGFGVGVKLRGRRSDEGQGYGQVGLVMRSDRPSPLRAAFKWPPPRLVAQMTQHKPHRQARQTFVNTEYWRNE